MKNALQLILTVDYELFGNGAGDCDFCVLRPAERMRVVAERFGAPLTLFVESLEFSAMERHRGDDRPREQIRRLVQGGHDVQLHLHPQWWGAELDTGGKWRLDMTRWRLGGLGADLVARMTREGKAWLEGVVGRPDYRCIAFRAGGWCIQPSDWVLAALKETGFRIDSTVAPGFHNASPGEWCDFRATPDRPFWPVTGDVCVSEAGEGLLEVPIATAHVGAVRHLRALRRAKAVGGLARGCKGSYRGPDGPIGRMLGKISKLARLGWVMLDLSTMPAEVLIEVTRRWLARHAGAEGQPLPVVAIAHTKNFTAASERALVEYLGWARDAGLRFSTFGQWLETVDGCS